jgi:hypothetical protein
MRPKTQRTYDVLTAIAAETTEPITYGHLAAIIDVPRYHLGAVLKAVHQHCVTCEEPDVTAFVVSSTSDEVLEGFAGSDPAVTRKNAHDFFRKRKWGI